MKLRNFALSAVMVVVSVVLMLGVGEVVLRVKNSSMRNYDVEMWRYSRELKVAEPRPDSCVRSCQKRFRASPIGDDPHG